MLTATLTYKNESDEINVYLTVHSNAYVADTIIFPLKSSIEIKVSYLKITDVLKSKIRIADNSEWNDITRRYPFEETYISFDICFLSRRERNTIWFFYRRTVYGIPSFGERSDYVNETALLPRFDG